MKDLTQLPIDSVISLPFSRLGIRQRSFGGDEAPPERDWISVFILKRGFATPRQPEERTGQLQ
jgi:hypothetical protein